MRIARRLIVLSVVLFAIDGWSATFPSKRVRALDSEASGVRLDRVAATSTGVVLITDATGDARINSIFDAPGTHVHTSGNTITGTIPTWTVNNITTANWSLASVAPDGNTVLKETPGVTWTAGSPSQVTSAPDTSLPDYADPVSISIQQGDSQHITFSVTTRGIVDNSQAAFEFNLGGYTVDLFPDTPGLGQVIVTATKVVGGIITKHQAQPYEDIVAATGENRNGVLHMTLTTAGPIPTGATAGEAEVRYIWNFQGSQNRLAVRFDGAKWVLETRLNLGTFFPQITPAHGTFSISGNTITVDEPVSDLDFHELAWNAQTAVDVIDGADTFYTVAIDSAPDKHAFTPPPLNVGSFNANPATIRPGQAVTLSWVTQGASSVDIDNGVGTQPASGSVTVTPSTNTTYTLTASSSTSTITATATVTVFSNPIVNVTALPTPLLQLAGSGGATTSYALTNSGGAATTITLSQSGGSFFTQSPPSFTLQPGATQVVTITSTAQSAGSYTGASLPSGNGVPAGLQVPVLLLSAAPPSGPVTADPTTTRVDVAAAATTNPTGSVSFTNNGTATLTGILSSDVPWIVPQSGVVTIAPGQTVTLTFSIDRSKRPDAASLIGSAEGNLTLSFLNGGGSTFAKRTLDNTTPIPSVSLVKIIDTVQPAITTAGIPALAAGEVALIVPGVGHITGAHGTLFVSDVSLLNPQGSQSVDDVKLYYTSVSGSAVSAKSTALSSVPSQVSVAVADVVKNVFSGTNEVGTLQIRSASASKLAVAATVLTANNAAGTFGNSIPVFRSDRAADSSGTIVLTGVRKDATTHTNLFVQEMAGAVANIQIDFLSATGTTITSLPQSIDAFKLLQLNDVVPPNAVAILITNNSTTGGKIAAYATPMDETSSDTWTIADWAEQLGYAPNEPVVIPVAGSVHGANNTFYRTDVAITNRGTDPASGTLRYITRTGSHVDLPVSIGGKQSQNFSDVVGTAMNVTGDSVGFLEFFPTGTFAISSRSFTTVANKTGTFGTGVPAIAMSTALNAGDSRPIAGLSDASRTTVLAGRPGTFRTNFGLMEISGQPVTVRVTFRFNFPAGAKAQGIGAASRDYALNGDGFLMLNSIAGEILGPARLQYGDLTNVEADFQVLSGNGSVVLFTSSVDNATGDSILRTQ